MEGKGKAQERGEERKVMERKGMGEKGGESKGRGLPPLYLTCGYGPGLLKYLLTY